MVNSHGLLTWGGGVSGGWKARLIHGLLHVFTKADTNILMWGENRRVNKCEYNLRVIGNYIKSAINSLPVFALYRGNPPTIA